MAGVQRPPGLSANWELPCSVLCLVTQSCPTLCDTMNCSPPGSSVHGDYPGKNTGVGCHGLFQGILPTQGSNPGLQHCRWILYHLSHQERELLYVCVCVCIHICVYTYIYTHTIYISPNDTVVSSEFICNLSVKEFICSTGDLQETRVISLGHKDPLE